VTELLDKVWPIFEAESREQAQALAAGVMALETVASPASARDLKRLAHTLKGSAASLGVLDIEQVAHAIEDLLALADGERALPADVVEVLLRAIGALEASLEPDVRGSIAQLDLVLAQLRAVLDRHGLAPAEPRLAPRAESGGSDVLETLASELSAVVTSDGQARIDHATRARAAAERLASSWSGPASALAARLARAASALELDGDDFARVIAQAAGDLVALRAAAPAVPAPAIAAPDRGLPRANTSRAPEPAPGPASRTVRVDAARLDALATDVDQLVVGVSRREHRGRDLARTDQGFREALRLLERGLVEAGLGEDVEARPKGLADGLARLRAVAAEVGGHAREIRRESEAERLSTRGLRDALQDLRMVPAEATLAALRPAVRDVAAQLGKRIALVVTGGDVRLDRRVLEELRPPLLHLVRNAVDHGVESPEAREAAGKPAEAVIQVGVESRGDRVVITVRDDGAGLSPDRLRAAAVARGLVTADAASRLTDVAAARLAFEPGLSTAASVTAVSGRGVGLDVVAEAARRLGGGVDVTFEHGRGTTFVLDVPLTLAGATGLLVRAAGASAVIPLDAIERVLLVGPGDVGRVADRATVCVDGDQIPFSALARAVGAVAPPRSGAESTIALVVASAGRRIALAVDEVLGEHAIVVTPLGRRLSGVRHLAGAAVLDDGHVVSVLRAAELVPAQRTAEPLPEARPRIVVADDSLSTRFAVKTLLETAGYTVFAAGDGEEAFALAREAGCELVVSDIQMPRLDGLGLTRRLRANERLSAIPVVLVTSLDTAEDRAAGLEAGASGYVVKRDVQHGKLLDLVRQLLPA
jgi:two-component system, chemotaxis family, sensor kinase CheA